MISGLHAQGLDVLDSVGKLANVIFGFHAEEILIEHSSVIVDTNDPHSVGEWGDVQFFKEFSFGGADNIAWGDEIFGGCDLDLTFLDLGGHLQGMEKFDVGGVDSGGALGDDDLAGGDLVNFGSARLGESLNSWLQVPDEFVGEDHGHSVFDESFQDLEVGHASRFGVPVVLSVLI